VHIPKSAGISLRAALEPYADGQKAAHPNTTHETLTALLAREARIGGLLQVRVSCATRGDRLVSFHAYAREKLRPTVPQMQGLDFGNLLRLMDRGAAARPASMPAAAKRLCARRRFRRPLPRHWKGDFATVCAQA